MPRLAHVVTAFAVLFGAFSVGTAFADSCEAVRTACKGAGFVDGGASGGNGLAANCVAPLINGTAPPGKGKLALPIVSADKIAACAASKATNVKGGKSGKLNAKTLGADRVAAGGAPKAAKALPTGAKAGPNIVMILVDDFSLDLMTTRNNVLGQSMPNLAKMMQDGVTFTNYFVTDSLCCPSRSSIFTGLLPHNSGVYTNDAPDGGFAGFMAHNDDAKTFAVALHDAFYQTVMMGKYLNGYQPDQNGVPQGWSDWLVAGNGYPEFNYVLNKSGTLITSELHLTDELSAQAQDFISNGANGPFFMEIATFSPHAPYTPPARYADAFPNLEYPRSPAFGARPDETAPAWLQEIPALRDRDIARITESYRKRVQSDKGVDDMIGAVRDLLVKQGLADNTYVIFTSDNGYHMGEYSLRSGKQTPFDTDIHVPLIVVGPGLEAGRSVADIAMNIDFYPTFVELAGLPSTDKVDGHSLAALLHGQPGPGRNIAVVEHVNAPPDASNPDLPEPKAGNPPTYVALRLPDAMYVEYDGGEVGYYDLKADPFELHNIAGKLSTDRLKALHLALEANHSCVGATQCAAAQNLTP